MKKTNMASTRRRDYGMTCVQCGNVMIAPQWSQFVNKQRIVHFWSCTECGCCLEIVEFLPANAKAKLDRRTLKTISPFLLVA